MVAATDILPGTAIEENMIAETQVPLKFLQPGAFSSFRDAVGQVPAVPIQEGGPDYGNVDDRRGDQAFALFPIGEPFRLFVEKAHDS